MPTFATLDKYYEADDVPVAVGGTPGSTYRDIAIPAGEIWNVNEFGGSGNIDSTEVELLYSEDGGDTFINPYDDGADKIRCIHLAAGSTSKIFLEGVQFTGGTDRILRILCKNYNEVNVAEVAGWMNGVIRK